MNFCDLATKSDTGQHSQYLRCLKHVFTQIFFNDLIRSCQQLYSCHHPPTSVSRSAMPPFPLECLWFDDICFTFLLPFPLECLSVDICFFFLVIPCPPDLNDLHPVEDTRFKCTEKDPSMQFVQLAEMNSCFLVLTKNLIHS